MADPLVSLDDKQQILDAMLAVPALHNPDLRNMYVTELGALLGRPLEVDRYADARHDLWSVLTKCLEYTGGLRTFVGIVRRFHPDNEALAGLDELVGQLEGGSPLTQPDRDALNRLLAAVTVAQVAEAVTDLVEPGELAALSSWRDVPAVLRRLEQVPGSVDGVPHLLAFVSRLAGAVGGARAEDLYRWVDTVAGGLGVDRQTLRRLRRGRRYEGASVRVAGSEPARVVTVETTVPTAPEGLRQIWGGVPIRNPDFTGRAELLRDLSAALRTSSKASVLPQTLHGLGGVGKTQLVVEYVYRHVDAYDLVWWIPAEQPSLVQASLAALGERLGVPASEDLKQTVNTVLDALATSTLRWLLVFDNADLPDEIAPFVPSAGGHVILTSRNAAWSSVWDAIEVDVFERSESIELLQKRGTEISEADADKLAAKMGDLPLALEQAVAWHLATGMPVAEYLELFDDHVRELLSEGKPTTYQTTVDAFVSLAIERLRELAPATAQLMELFAFLSAEPVPVLLLRRGRGADVSQPLARALREPIEMNRIIRDLTRYGLAKVQFDQKGQRIHVHRLVQLVLRESLSEELSRRTLSNVRNILAAANPGDPDDEPDWSGHREMTPHVYAANLVDGDAAEVRQVVLDQIRYLYLAGDYEGSRRLAELAVDTWRASTHEELGPDGGHTLIATRHLANALRAIGDSATAQELTTDTFERLRRNPRFGPDHELTLITWNSVALDLRIAGNYRQAYEADEENLAAHRRVFGDGDHYTLRVQSNLGVDQRMLGDFPGAYETDQQVLDRRRERFGDNHALTLLSVSNLARDLYALGRYGEALTLQLSALPRYQDLLGPRHSNVLLATRTLAITLRKAGRHAEALAQARENYRDYHARFGPDHEHTVAATISYANALRTVGQTGEARAVAMDALDRYRSNFGPRHPLTLVAATNVAIILRASGMEVESRALDEQTLDTMTEVLGPEHPYTLCVQNGLANDLAALGEATAARGLTDRTLAMSRRVRGEEHPYTLGCAVNLAIDLQATGDADAGRALLDQTLVPLRRVLGPDHPEVLDAQRYVRQESDIEPPPT